MDSTVVVFAVNKRAKLCICKIRHSLPQGFDTRQDVLRALGLSRTSGAHHYSEPEVTARKHLTLAIVLSALALACQVDVVHRGNGPRRTSELFMYVDGNLQRLSQNALVLKVKSHNGGDDQRAGSVEYCLNQD